MQISSISTDAPWCPLALAADIEPGTAAGTVWKGAEIVIWRDSAGRLHAWEDRCPHRGMKLSFGFVRGDRLACLYHGWEFGGDASCRYIPAHPELSVPATIRVARYQVAEALSMVWVAHADVTEPLPNSSRAITGLRSLQIDRSAPQIADLLCRVGLPGCGAVMTVKRLGPLIQWQQKDLSLIAGVQAVTDDSCILHLGIENELPGRARAALVPATVALRNLAESPSPEGLS
ncbi:MAG: Rieske 2Fe-2S domain-containing protein [Roseinatronobacter sp.]